MAASTKQSDLLVIGAGPGGYAAAFRAADLGRRVTLVDPRPTLGGVCLNEGCIPSKALLHAAEIIRASRSMRDWGIDLGDPKIDIDGLRSKMNAIVGQLTGGLARLAKKRKVETVTGTAKFINRNEVAIDSNGVSETIRFDQAIIAAGSEPVCLPGFPQDDPRIMDSQGALKLSAIPRRLVIVGGGIIGLEMATVYSALGSDVTIIELADQIVLGADKEAARILHAAMEEHGCIIHCSTKVSSVDTGGKSLRLTCEGALEREIEADALIQAVGRRANGQRLDADKAGIAVARDGTIPVNEQCRTEATGIFAVGDITGAPMLAHRATHQGKTAAEAACGHCAAFDTKFIPSVAYTDPELAWAGLTLEAARAENVAHKVSKFPWTASGRNLASGAHPGMTKILWCPESQRILGATIIGPNAGELLGEIVLGMEMGTTLEDISLTVHAHPSLSETTAFACEMGLGTCTDL